MKKLKLSMIFAAVALLAIGCSNLWDYDPPKTNTPPPINPTEPPVMPPPSASQKTLTFWVFDGNGEKQKIEITVDSSTEKVNADKIKEVIKKYHKELLNEENLSEGLELEKSGGDFVLYESDLSTLANGSYEDGAVLVIGVKTKYTSSITTPDGGKVVYLTDSDFETAGEQTLSDILTAARITDPSNPGTAPAGWTFKGWEKVGQPDNTPIDPSTYDTATYPSGTSFVAVYDVPYKINIGGTDYTVKVPVTAPNEGATWEHILAAAKADSGILSNPLVSDDPAKLDSLLWSDGEGAPSKTGGKQYPAGTSFTGYETLSFNVNGQEVKVPVEAGKTTATWAEIKDAAIAEYGEDAIKNPTPPASGYRVDVWTFDGANANDGDLYSPTKEFKPSFVKDVLFYITDEYKKSKDEMKQLKKTVKWGDTEEENLTAIFNRAEALAIPITRDGKTVTPAILSETEKLAFDGWRVKKPNDSDIKVVRFSEIAKVLEEFPDGTMIKPNWICQLYVDKGWETTGVDMDFTYFEGGQGGYTQVGDFYIANTEVTRAQWQKVMSYKGLGDKRSGTRVKDGSDWKEGTWMNEETEGAKSQWEEALNSGADPDPLLNMSMPMNYVSWYDAIMFCNMLSLHNERTPYYYFTYTVDNKDYGKTSGEGGYDAFFEKLNELYTPTFGDGSTFYDVWKQIEVKTQEDLNKPGFRLPSGDYWKYAAHGGKQENGKWIYPTYSGTTGSDEDDLVKVAWYKGGKGDSGGKVHPVGTKGGDNPIRDMSGNVWEWTEDKYYWNTRMYIGGPYDAGATYQRIENTDAMFGTKDGQKTAGKTGDRSSMGMRVIVYGTANENYEDYFD